MGYKVVITTNTGDEITADDSVVERQGTAAYNQMCNKRDILIKDSDDNAVFVPFVNIVKADVSVSDAPGPSVGVRKQVAFFDYDGTITNTYDVDEFAELTSLPDNPSHDGLVAQGWNWSLADAKEYLEKYPEGEMNIGQMYITESGDTEIDIELFESIRLSPYLALCIDGEVEIDWGDGSAKETVTGASLVEEVNTQHVYPAIGSYTISIHVVSGSFVIGYDDADKVILNAGPDADSFGSDAYFGVIRIRLGNDVSIGKYAFRNRRLLESITMPNSITDIGTEAFNGSAIRSITIPIGVTSIGSCVFCDAELLESISIPNGVTEILDWEFDCCYKLRSLTIPDSVTFIDEGAFEMTYSLRSIVLPDGITRIEDHTFNESAIKKLALPSDLVYIGESAFQSSRIASLEIPLGVTEIGKSALSSQYLMAIELNEGLEIIGDYVLTSSESVSSLTIPSTVTQIGKMGFQIEALIDVHVKPIVPPTIGNDPFHSILNAYKAATNWSNYASQIQEEPA